MDDSTKTKADRSAEHRARLIELGRQGGMLDVEISAALRISSVRRIAGNRTPAKKRLRLPSMPKTSPELAAHMSRVAVAFFRELAVTSYPRCTLEDIRTGAKLRRYADPMKCLSLLFRELTPASFPAIAAYVGRMDHTTIMQAVETAPEAWRREPDLAHVVAKVRASVAAAGRQVMA